MAILTITKGRRDDCPAAWTPANIRGVYKDVDADGTGETKAENLFRDRVASKRKLLYRGHP